MSKNKNQKPSKDRNQDIELRWVDAWNDLYEIAGKGRTVDCFLPDGVVVDFEGGLEWLQTTVYQGFRVTVERGSVLGRPGAILLRSSLS